MLSLQTLANLEAMLLSKSDIRWGEFHVLAQVISDVQAEKQYVSALMNQARVQPAAAVPQTNANEAGAAVATPIEAPS